MEFKINENSYGLDLNQLMVIGKRSRNSKRNFLFISKVIGKHVEVRPDICRAMGYLLASLIYGKTKETQVLIDYINQSLQKTTVVRQAMERCYQPIERVAVLGFAETATGLGMAVASAITDSYYLHTTREPITEYESLLQFEEEHSHATTHRCYPLNQEILATVKHLILVDDELTTGKSVLNIIQELIRVTPIRKFTVLSILDWRTDEHQQIIDDFCAVNKVEIEIRALVKGEVILNEETVYEDECPDVIASKQEIHQLQMIKRLSCETSQGIKQYYAQSGRFGIAQEEILELELLCEQIAKQIQSKLCGAKRVLVLGHGEDIYIPSRIAAYLEGNVFFKSTTRSPIYCELDGPIQQKHLFYDGEIPYYFYNKDGIEAEYDQVVWITERPLNVKLTSHSLNVQL